MQSKVVLDTNFICSLLNRHDVNHKAAKLLYTEYCEDSVIIIPVVVKVELLGIKELLSFREKTLRFVETS